MGYFDFDELENEEAAAGTLENPEHVNVDGCPKLRDCVVASTAKDLEVEAELACTAELEEVEAKPQGCSRWCSMLDKRSATCRTASDIPHDKRGRGKVARGKHFASSSEGKPASADGSAGVDSRCRCSGSCVTTVEQLIVGSRGRTKQSGNTSPQASVTKVGGGPAPQVLKPSSRVGDGTAARENVAAGGDSNASAPGPQQNAAPDDAASSQEVRSQLATLQRLIKELEGPVDCILKLRLEVDKSMGIRSESLQKRLRDQEMRLTRRLAAVRASADALDNAEWASARSRLMCATPGCPYRVHGRVELGSFCCLACSEGGEHGPRCERASAPPNATRADAGDAVHLGGRQLADLELDEAVRLTRLTLGAPSGLGAASGSQADSSSIMDVVGIDSQLVSDPSWSKSGKAAVNKWVSSILDEEWGSPETHGPEQMLTGGQWISRRGQTKNQWIIFDFGKETLISEVHTRGHYVSTAYNAKDMTWQAGDGLQGPWRNLVAFVGSSNSDWVVAKVDPPASSRWWRLRVHCNFGDSAHVWLHGFCVRQQRRVADLAENSEAWEEDPGRFEKYSDTSITHEDLRKHDADWLPLAGYQKIMYHALLHERIPFLKDQPYIDCRQHSVVDYTHRFLAQPHACGWSLDFNPNFFCELAYEGFNPISMQIPSDSDLMIQVLTPWFGTRRYILECQHTHVARNVRKRAKHYFMTMDTCFDDVLLGCVRQHGEAWLYRGVRWVLRHLWQYGYTGRKPMKFQLHTFELWDEDGRLVAGDLGYSVGSLYVSMTGFRLQYTRGAGEMQLVLMSALLLKMGFSWFDLGMLIKYKARLGAKVLDRSAFIARLHAVRDDQDASFAHERIAGDELLHHLLEAQRVRCEEESYSV